MSEAPYDLEVVKENKKQQDGLYKLCEEDFHLSKENRMRRTNPNNPMYQSQTSQLRTSSIQMQGEPQHDKYWHQPSRDQHLWHQSSSTWRHSSNKFHFGKESRFENSQYKKRHQVYNSSIYSLPSTRNKLSCSQGFGQREMYPIHHSRVAKVNPAPDQYQLPSFVKDNRLSKSFGLGWGKYYSCYYPEYYKTTMKKPQPEFMRHSVGPGRYEVREKIGNDKVKYSFGLKRLTKDENDNPPCNMYSLKEKLVQNERFSKITLGKGNKIDLAKPLNHNPGPGNYQIPCFTDKFTNKHSFRHRRTSSQYKPSLDVNSPIKINKWVP